MFKGAAKQTPKVVADPIYGIIDIRPVLPMIETKEFQALGDKRQLGMAYLTFPSATHSRKTHCLGAYHATRELADWWIKRGFINEREGRALAGYALYHDIGHPAFSHVTEDLCRLPGDIKNAKMSANAALSIHIIRKLRKEIEACGIDFKLMESIATHKDPLYLAVSDKNLGMEKLDYLERDGAYTILSRPVGVEYLRHHIYFINGKLAIDEKVIDNAIDIQNYYLKIYKNVYLRKTAAIAQRMLQKMTFNLIQAGELPDTELHELTDSELLGFMRFSQNEFVMEMYDLLKRRELFREAIVIRPQKFAFQDEMKEGKGIVFGATPREIKHLTSSPKLSSKNQTSLAALESAIADIADIPQDKVLVTPIYGHERFEAQDIMIYEGPGRKLASLKARYPAHFKNIEEVGQTYIAFRVCTIEKYRKTLSTPKIAKQIYELILSY